MGDERGTEDSKQQDLNAQKARRLPLACKAQPAHKLPEAASRKRWRGLDAAQPQAEQRLYKAHKQRAREDFDVHVYSVKGM